MISFGVGYILNLPLYGHPLLAGDLMVLYLYAQSSDNVLKSKTKTN